MVRAVAEIIAEIVLSMTGHGLLWVLTLGRWKAFESSDALATIVGVLFWAGVAGLVFFSTR